MDSNLHIKAALDSLQKQYEVKLLEKRVDLKFWNAKQVTALDIPQQGINPATGKAMQLPSELEQAREQVKATQKDIDNIEMMLRCINAERKELEGGVKN